MVKQISDSNEIPTKGLVIIDFFATWCGPCKRMAPLFSDLENKYPTVKFLKVDCDESGDIATAFSVQALPTFVFLRDGKRVASVKGADIISVTTHLDALIAA
jgi:thioredoxin 1